MKPSSTKSTRLALALLALAGFAAPAAERELDGVVQTSGDRPRAHAAELVSPQVQRDDAPTLRSADTLPPALASRALRSLYLLHRAWLL